MSSVELLPEDLPDVAPHNHGRTVAAWSAMAGVTVAFLLAGIGMAVPVPALIWAGSILCAISLIAGIVLRALGHGQPVR